MLVKYLDVTKSARSVSYVSVFDVSIADVFEVVDDGRFGKLFGE